jgi:long-chain acyl-CoA synthetase
VFATLTECFEAGFARGNDGDNLFTGYRPMLSSNPVTFASHFVWETYKQVDERRRNIGSALEKLFRDGTLGQSSELQTVGIWSQNRPGNCRLVLE